ncbi:MAG TPA: hypothetical protein VG271_05510 [Beijerinckiaceae bacterium]|nr:hypothetical protein [Beijerinckiaceae bacterium]
MTEGKGQIVIMLDESTPVLAGSPFLQRGYQVIYHKDVLPPGASDPVVVATAILNKAILIAVDGDIKRMAKRFGAPDLSEKFKSLDLIFIDCNEVLAAKRLEHAMSFIENEWKVVCKKKARRLWLSIGPHKLTSFR